MKKQLLALAMTSAISAGAMAQANVFEGFSAGVSVSSVGSTTELSGNGSSVNMGQQSMVPTIEAGYTFGINKDFAVGLTATYDLSDTKSGSANNLNFKGTNHYSVNLKPGYVTGNTMLYAILGYHGMKGTANYLGESASLNFNGFGAGAGIAVLLTKNVFVKAEAQQITYSSKTDGATFKPSATVGTIGVGYKF
jgi:opacity protein-like surface antigen